MSEEENERDFMKTCFNVVAGLEVKNESQAIAKEVILDEVENLTKENNQLKEVIEEVREYITSYSSIHTIQFGTEEDSLNDIELNKTLDEKTITEITNRYLKVHDKLLQILDKVGVKDV